MKYILCAIAIIGFLLFMHYMMKHSKPPEMSKFNLSQERHECFGCELYSEQYLEDAAKALGLLGAQGFSIEDFKKYQELRKDLK